MIRVDYIYICDGCKHLESASTETIRFAFYREDILPKPHGCIPNGWFEIDGRLYCPKHNVIVTCDDEIVRAI